MSKSRTNHLIRVSHHDTGMIETYCGEEIKSPVEPDPDYRDCGVCVVEAMNNDRRITDEKFQHVQNVINSHAEDLDRLKERACRPTDFHISLFEYDQATLRLEMLEKQVAKLLKKKPSKKKGKK